MLNGFIKFIIGTFLGLAISLLTAFNVLLLWVATGPRSLDVLTPYIEATFEPPDHSYSISIDETWLIWDGWKHPIDIRMRNIVVRTKERQKFFKFPEISMGLDVLSLMQGQLLPTSLTITHPTLQLFQNDDRSINFGFRKEKQPSAMIIPPADTKPETASPAAGEPPGPPESAAEEMLSVPLPVVLAPLVTPDDKSTLRKLRLVNIINADISVRNFHKGVFFTTNDANLVFKHNRQGIHAYGSSQITYDQNKSDISVEISKDTNSPTYDGVIDFTGLIPGTLASLFSDNNMLGALKLPMNGKGKIVLDTTGTLLNMNFMVDGGKGTINTDKLETVLPVSSLHMEGQLLNNANDVQISTLHANFDGMLLDSEGTVTIKNNDIALRANATIKNVPMERIHILWPPALAPRTREWVTANISEGKVSEAEAHFNIAFGDLAKSDLPKEAVDATMHLEGSKLRYLPDHPQLSEVQATVHADGVSMQNTIESAKYLKSTQLSGGKMVIDDLNADNPYIKLTFDADTTAKDMVHFLGLPRLKHAQRLNLNEDTAEGTAKCHIAVGFNFFAPKDAEGKPQDADITYDVTGAVKGLTQPGFLEKFDIKNSNGTIALNNDGIEYKGDGEVNGALVSESDVKYFFKPEDGFDTMIDAKAVAPVEVLPRFGYPQFPFLKGALGVNGIIKLGKNLQHTQAALDLTNATVTLPDMGWVKPDKEKAVLDISSDKKNEVMTIPSFHLKGNDVDAEGSAEFNKEFSSISHVNLSKLMLGNTELNQLIYDHTDGGFSLEMHGKRVDLHPWVDSDGDNTFSFEHFPAAHVNVDVSELTLGKDRKLGNIKGELNCDPQRCTAANFSGTTSDNKSFVFRILRNPKGNRQLSLHAQSAGAFLKALNVFDGMEGGDLTITGSYNDSGATSVLKGMVDINEHTVKDAPVLAKILSLASLTGFFDTLQGKGIEFSRLRAPFTLSKDVITVDKGKTHGSAMGLTADGTITFPKRTLDINGTIVPSYSLNTVLGNVPLLGNVLTGGEGQGVFAARYTIKGAGKDMEVAVNPLSILTPGFMRGLFDVLDKPAKKTDDDSE